MPLRIRMATRQKGRPQWIVYEKNLELLQRQLAESDPTKNPERHNMLLRLLAEEQAKEKKAL
jgi:hypothetical protein